MKLADIKNAFFDHEYTIMSEIVDNENVSQRELSKKLGISVSTVNVLINKMIKEGLIKMTQVSQKQVFYMLTPMGMMEKAKKTMRYLKIHYRAIYETKEKIKMVFEELKNEYDMIFVLMNQDEMSEIISIALEEFEAKHGKVNIKVLDYTSDLNIKNVKSSILVHMTDDEEILKKFVDISGLKVMSLTEKL